MADAAQIADLDAQLNQLLAAEPDEAARLARERSVGARVERVEAKLKEMEALIDAKLDAFSEEADARIRDACLQAATAVKRLQQ